MAFKPGRDIGEQGKACGVGLGKAVQGEGGDGAHDVVRSEELSAVFHGAPPAVAAATFSRGSVETVLVTISSSLPSDKGLRSPDSGHS